MAKKYTYKEYMVEKNKLHETYADEIILYYKEAFTYHLLTNDILTRYRQDLLNLVNEQTFLSDDGLPVDKNGEVIKKQGDLFNLQIVSDSENKSGLVNYSIVQYEHDKKVDQYVEKYNTNLFDYEEFRNDEFSTKQTNYDYTFSPKNNKFSDRTNIKLKELIYTYSHKNNKLYTGVFSWKDKFLMAKLQTSLEFNPMIPILDIFIERNDLTIRVVKKSEVIPLHTLTGSKILRISNRGWTIESDDFLNKNFVLN
jgi:hypothetical protein